MITAEALQVLVVEDNFTARGEIVEKLGELGVTVIAEVGFLDLALEYIDHQTSTHPRQKKPIPRLHAVLFDANLHDEKIRDGKDAITIDQHIRQADARLGTPYTKRIGISASDMLSFGVAPDADPGKHPYQVHIAMHLLFPDIIPAPSL